MRLLHFKYNQNHKHNKKRGLVVAFLSKVSTKCNEVKLFIENNSIIAILFFILSAIVGTLISSGVDAAMKSMVPELDDTMQIIENQNKQFNEVQNNLSKLQSVLSGDNREIFAELKDSYQESFKTKSLKKLINIY